MRVCQLGFFLLLLSLMPRTVLALEVSEAVITTGVTDRRPVDAIQVYPATVEKLFCFTRVTGASEESSVVHVWYMDGEEMTRMVLPVRSENWRTWSAKTIFPGSAGEWRVDVLDKDGEVLESVSFTLN